MPQRLNRATNLGLVVNIFLFVLKAIVGLMSNSIAVISESVNSLTDIISSIAIKYSVKISGKQPDDDHHFGHHAAQPLAAFIVSVFAFVVGINIIEESIKRIIAPEKINEVPAVYVVLALTMLIKIALNRYQLRIGKMYSSPALKAAAVDSLNDVLTSVIALLGVLFTTLGFKFLDGIAGVLVAFFIFKTGYEVGRENIDYLMGRAADSAITARIIQKAISVNGVKGFHDLRSHYVGDKFHVEIHIEVDKNSSTVDSHNIGDQVRDVIEDMDEIQKVFVHIDPV